MNYKNLNYIIEIARTQNITRAAEHLYISQSALSIYLQKIEKEYGCSFFTRDKNSLILTPEGNLFVETAKEILRLDQDLRHKISASHTQELSIGSSSEIGFQIVSQVAYKFKNEHPDFKITLNDRRSGHLLNALKEKSLDFIIVPKVSRSLENGLTQKILKTEELVFVLPSHHPLADLASSDYEHPPTVDVTLFQNEKFVIAPSDTIEHGLVLRIFKDAHIQPNIIFEINRTRHACQMVLDGVALSIQPSFCVPRDMNLLVCKPSTPYFRYLALIYRKDRILRKEERLLITEIQTTFDNWYF